MNYSFTTIQILLFVGAAQGLVLSCVLFTIKRANRTANRLLAVILTIFSLNIVFHNLSHDKHFIGIPHHEFVIGTTLYLYGPMVYLYVRFLTANLPERKIYYYFLPFITAIIISTPFYIISINSEKPHIILEFMMGTAVASVFIYMLVVVKLLIKHAQNIKNSFSSIERINLRWLMILTSGFTILLFSGFLLDAFKVTLIGWNAVWLMISLFMYIIGYMGLRQPEIFTDVAELKLSPEPQTLNQTIKKKYEKSTLTQEAADLYFKKLISYTETEKPYLNSNLTLPELANCISIPVHHLSQIINEKLNQNFFEFINSYRVEEAKKRLIAPEFQNYNIISIGLDSGFNSVSAFNAAFKKIAKITPSQFRNSK